MSIQFKLLLQMLLALVIGFIVSTNSVLAQGGVIPGGGGGVVGAPELDSGTLVALGSMSSAIAFLFIRFKKKIK